MKVNWELQEGSKGVLTVEVGEEVVNKAIDDAFKAVAPKVSIPGFRKGRVPRIVFEKRLGVESLYNDAAQTLVPQMYQDALGEVEIEPMGYPDFEIEQFEQGKPCIVKITVPIRPDVELGEYKGIAVPHKDFSVSDEHVDAELLKIQTHQGYLVPAEEGETVQQGSQAMLDMEVSVDGEVYPNGKAENLEVEIGKTNFVAGIEEQLIGMSQGEEKAIEVSMPEDYHVEEIAGKNTTFKIKVKELKKFVLPELDDEFAKDVSEEVETLAELKNKIREELELAATEERKAYIGEYVINAVLDNAKVEIPSDMIDQEVNAIIREMKHNLAHQYQGIDIEKLGITEDVLKEQAKPDAEKRVKASLVFPAIGKKEGITLSDSELYSESLAQPDKFEVREDSRAAAFMGKVVDYLVSQAEVEATVS